MPRLNPDSEDTQFEYCPVCNRPVLYWMWVKHVASHAKAEAELEATAVEAEDA